MDCKYQKGKIYVIKNSIDDNIYVGSTIKTLKDRFGKHKVYMKQGSNMKLYQHVTKLGGWDCFTIELHEDYPCNSKSELRVREGQVIRELEPQLNSLIPGRTKKEHYEANKDKIAEYHKQYHEANKDKINEQKKQVVTCECGDKASKNHIARHRKSQKHINKMAELNKI